MEGEPRGCDGADEDEDELDGKDGGFAAAAFADGFGEKAEDGAEEDVKDVDAVAEAADPTQPGGG